MTVTKTPPNKAIDWSALKLIYEEGGSDIEIARELGISMREFSKMEKDIPTFARFVELGRTMAQAWWYKMGRRNIANKEFNTSLYNFNMKNRFGWADKVETSTTPADESLNQDQLRAEFARAIKQASKKDPELLRMLNGEDSDRE